MNVLIMEAMKGAQPTPMGVRWLLTLWNWLMRMWISQNSTMTAMGLWMAFILYMLGLVRKPEAVPTVYGHILRVCSQERTMWSSIVILVRRRFAGQGE